MLCRLPFMNGDHSQLCRICGIEKQHTHTQIGRPEKAKGKGNRGERKGRSSERMPATVAFWRAEENLSTRFWMPKGHGGDETQGQEGLHATLCSWISTHSRKCMHIWQTHVFKQPFLRHCPSKHKRTRSLSRPVQVGSEESTGSFRI